MATTIQCIKLGREADGMEKPPFKGALGQRLFEHVSAQAWKTWLEHSKMLINEYRLTPVDPKARKLLETEMEKFFFGDGSAKPDAFKDPEA